MSERLAIFDLDRTLTRPATFSRFCLFALARRPWRGPRAAIPLAGLVGYKAGAITRGRWKELALAAALGGVAREDAMATARAFVDDWVAGRLNPGARPAVEAARAEGRRLALATAAPEFYARLFAEALGLDDVIATETIWADGRLSGRLGANCYGSEKLARVRAAYPQDDLADAIVYSDDLVDAPLLAAAGRGVVVTASAHIAAEARARGFEVENWRDVPQSAMSKATPNQPERP